MNPANLLGFGTLSQMLRILQKADRTFWILAAASLALPFLSAVYLHQGQGSFVNLDQEVSLTPLWIWFGSMMILYNLSIARLVGSWTNNQGNTLQAFLRFVAGRTVYILAATLMILMLHALTQVISSPESSTIARPLATILALLFLAVALLFMPIAVSWIVTQASPNLPGYPCTNITLLKSVLKRVLTGYRFAKFWQILILYVLIPITLAMEHIYGQDYIMLSALGINQTNDQNHFEAGLAFVYLLAYLIHAYTIDILGIATALDESPDQPVEENRPMPRNKNRLNRLPGNESEQCHARHVEPFVKEILKQGEFLGFPEDIPLALRFYATEIMLRNGDYAQFRHSGKNPERSYALYQSMLAKILEEHPEIPEPKAERILEDISQRHDGTICRFSDAIEDDCFRIDENQEVHFQPYTSVERKIRELDRTQRREAYGRPYPDLTPDGHRVLKAILQAHPEENAEERFQTVRREHDLGENYPYDEE